MAIVLRNVKGAPLTYNELDGNFIDIDTRISKNVRGDLLLNGIDTSPSQQPVGLDLPLQLSFGAPQSTPKVSLDAAGAYTLVEAQTYVIALQAILGRAGSSGTCNLFFYSEVDFGAGFIPTASSVPGTASNADDIDVWQGTILLTTPVPNTVVRHMLVRDSSGNNNGGVFTRTPTLMSIPVSPCIQIQIFDLNIESS